ncbi:MAG: hypothetical protein HON65_17185 [Rhodospirillales bacterium]|nr:hypothetical protein [Rhodospirillales bacterium]
MASALRPSHLPEMDLQCPTNLGDVFRHISNGAQLLAGGTDILLQASVRGEPNKLVWTGGIESMKEFDADSDFIKVGASVPLSTMIKSNAFRDGAPAVADGAQSVGSLQLRNQATMVGNVCTASPAADTVPGLLIHNCVVATIDKENNKREIALKDFLTGPGKTNLGEGELVTCLSFSRLGKNQMSAYQRFTQREALDLAFASVAARLEFEEDGQTLMTVNLALGAVGPTAIDASAAADILKGHPISEGRLDICADAASQLCSPISDHRASAGYRRQLIRALVGDVVRQAATRYGNKK